MEQITHDNEQIIADFQTKSISAGNSVLQTCTPVKRIETGGIQYLEANFVSLTPEKTKEPSHVKCRNDAAKLPEKYRILSLLFGRMTTSLRLLGLRKRLPTFQNISCQVETLTGREFSFQHLAQMKFILPEAVQIEKILIHNTKTQCVEPDIKVTLLFDVIQGHNEHSKHTALCSTFSSRLFNFINGHPEGCEVPEAALPEPFHQGTIPMSRDLLAVELLTEPSTNANDSGLHNPSHLQPSFCRRLSRKAVIAETEKTQLLASPVPPLIKLDCMTTQDADSRHQELPSMPESSVEPTPYLHPISFNACESTPMKLALENSVLIVETPAQSTPKRSVPSDAKCNSVTSKNIQACSISAKRSLHFSNLEGEDGFLDSNACGVECSGVIHGPSSHLGKIGDIFVEDDITCSAAPVKAEEGSDSTTKDDFVHPDELILHQHMPKSLPDLVDSIHNIYQSTHCSWITKEELVHKIIMNNIDIVESREVEEQLELLEKQVPDWINKKMAPSGDLLYSIRRVSDLNSIHEKIIQTGNADAQGE